MAAGAGPTREAWATGVMFPGAGFLYTRDPAHFAVTDGRLRARRRALVRHRQPHRPAGRVGGRRGAGRAARGAQVQALARHALRRRHGPRRARLRAAARAAQALQVPAEAGRGGQRAADARPCRRCGAPTARPSTSRTRWATRRWRSTRRFVDTAFKPLDDWEDWDVIEQFQPAALRYQIDHLIYTMALQKYARTPAFRGYHDEAMRRLIEKYQQKKVWSYWAYENLWGNFEWNPDPARKQNIMLTGFFALSLGAYQTVTGDYRHAGGRLDRVQVEREAPLPVLVRQPLRVAHLGLPEVAVGARGVRAELDLLDLQHARRRGSDDPRPPARHALLGHDQGRLLPRHGAGVRAPRRDAQLLPLGPHGIGQNGASFSTDLRPIAAAPRRPRLDAAARGLPGARRQARHAARKRDKLLDTGNYSFHPLKSYAYIIEEAREAGDERRPRPRGTRSRTGST